MTIVSLLRRGLPRTLLALAMGSTFFAANAAAAEAEDPFAAGVRPTDPKAPTEQRAAFRVPPGFEVQLVATEPDINKPMNLAFDATGRLWVTSSREYPYAVPVGTAGRDRVMIFEDFGPDGRARRVSTFADGLNIPIGVYPFRTGTNGWKAIVWSIPNIWLLEDSDNDGKADRRSSLYGPFDHTRDTHGNQASFRRGFDGWLYATHGYNNDSHVAGADGNQVHLNSGNTYRIRLDGSRIEQHTFGQVNPYGLAFDPRGDLFSSDCHSEPIYLLLPGGYYPSFGKPHDGLGFVPSMMETVRGSTAIDGISYYADDLWPAEYKDSVFIGDVMTSRVYRDLAVDRGSGRVTQAQPDFVISDDPWFRPVDTTFGPDGALYIADFYNKIIGHYEVPLTHPGRDRERGRIWRVVYSGNGKSLRPGALPQGLEALVDELGSPSLPRRMLATQEIADRFGAKAAAPLQSAFAQPRNAFQKVHTLWLLRRLSQLTAAQAIDAGTAADPLVRLHARRVAADWLADASRKVTVSDDLLQAAEKLALTGLADPAPTVQRAAVEALAERPTPGVYEPLLAFLPTIPQNDLHLRYSARRAFRNLLQRNESFFASLADRQDLSEPAIRAILDVAIAVKSEPAARFLLRFRERYTSDTDFTQQALAHAARHATPADLDTLAASLEAKPDADPDFQTGLFRAIQQGFGQRGVALTPVLKRWGGALATTLVASVAASTSWSNQPLDAAPNAANPWEFQERPCADGTSARLLSSLPRGEALTGTLRSRPFPAPAQLAFFLAGHDGPPDLPAQKLNAVRLLDAATGEVLQEAFPPRNDTARRIEWSLAALKNRNVVLAVTDADTGSAYAWLAFGRLEPGSIPFPAVAPATVIARQIAAAELASAAGTENLTGIFTALSRDRSADPAARAAAARAVSKSPVIRATAEVVADPSLPHAWRLRTADTLFDESPIGVETLITNVWRSAPRRFQTRFAEIGAANPDLTRRLLAQMESGSAPGALLLDRRLRERLRQAARDDDKATLDRLVQSLPNEDNTVQKLLDERRAALQRARPDLVRGSQVFTTACAPCHQIQGQGSLVGPQLNGIGTRGAERLFEDVLAPNRNVDHAFWTTLLTLKDGETVSGLFRREEGQTLVLANATGAEFSVPKANVQTRTESSQSLMPSNFGEAIPVEDLTHLMAFLLSQRGTP